jgi:hypothetical protein
MKLTQEMIVSIALAAGFGEAAMAAAIAMAESGGNTMAIGDNGTSYGLWQIHWTVHHDVYGADPKNLFQPAINASAALLIFLEQGWAAWSSYNSGAYKKFLLP